MSATAIGVFDRAALVARLEGDEGLVQEIVALFVEDGAAQLDQLDVAIAASDLLGVARVAHALKGAAGNVSALRVAEVARLLESAAHQRAAAESRAVAADLRAAFFAFCDAVRVAGIVPPVTP